jgi:hypothetical protein
MLIKSSNGFVLQGERLVESPTKMTAAVNRQHATAKRAPKMQVMEQRKQPASLANSNSDSESS